MVERVIRRQVHIEAPVERVWRALTVPDELNRWFTDGVVIELRPGGRLEFFWAPETRDAGQVLEVDPPHRLVFTWGTGGQQPQPTTVAITLTASRGGTDLVLVESGWGEGPVWDRIFRETDAGWTDVLGNLRSVLVEGRDRRARGYLGVDMADADGAVEVRRVLAEGPARDAGVEAGDRIHAINGHATPDARTARRILQGIAPGEPLTVELSRNGARRVVETRLAARR